MVTDLYRCHFYMSYPPSDDEMSTLYPLIRGKVDAIANFDFETHLGEQGYRACVSTIPLDIETATMLKMRFGGIVTKAE